MEKKIKVNFDGKETKEWKDMFVRILASGIYEYLKKEGLLSAVDKKRDLKIARR